MPTSVNRVTSRRAICLALAGLTTLATAGRASADDGLGDFLSSIFGGRSPVQQPAAAPTGEPVYRRSFAARPVERRARLHLARIRPRPLVVRLHPTAPRLAVAQMPTKPGTVTIFEDRTLKRGDAVMTADGIRVFAGSASWPYTKADFVDLAAAKDLNKDTVKVLAAVDRLPRS